MEEITQTYTIGIGDFTVGETTYPDRCLYAGIGGIGTQSTTIPWADTDYNPWDYKAEYEMIPTEDEDGNPTEEKHYTGVFTLDVIDIPTPVVPPTEEEKHWAQSLYTAMMTDTLIEEDSDKNAMREFVENIKYLYQRGAISKEYIDKLLNAGKITQVEYEYILDDEPVIR